MDITVNVDNIDLGDYIGTHLDEDGDRIPGGTLADAIAHQLVERFARSDDYRGLVGRVQAIRDDEIRQQLAPVISEAINNPMVKTNSYGEAAGETTTLREIIVKEARSHLGKWDQSYRASDTRTLLQKLIHEAIQSAFKDELADAVKEAREAVVGEFGTTVSQMVADTVRQALAKR